MILLICVLTGGIIMPLLNRYKPEILPQKLAILFPEAQLWFVASMTIAIKLIDKAEEAYNTTIFSRISELEELYLFYFVLLYLLALRSRLRTDL